MEDLEIVALKSGLAAWVDAYRAAVDRWLTPIVQWPQFRLPWRDEIAEKAHEQGSVCCEAGQAVWHSTIGGTFWKAIHDFFWFKFEVTEHETMFISVMCVVVAANIKGLTRLSPVIDDADPENPSIDHFVHACIHVTGVILALIVGTVIMLVFGGWVSVVSALVGIAAIFWIASTIAFEEANEFDDLWQLYLMHTFGGLGIALFVVATDFALFQLT